jgi:two-component system chemotaxis response regulator CheY
MSKKILVVDDAMFFLQIMRDFLEAMGYEVATETDAQVACKLVENKQFDMIFTDLNMPGMNGVEFAQAIKKFSHTRFVPVVMLSARENEPLVEFAKRSGISLFLPKPINEDRLRKILEMTIGGSSQTEMVDAG